MNDAVNFIKNSMTRIPYEENLEPQYNLVFNKLENFIKDKNFEDVQK